MRRKEKLKGREGKNRGMRGIKKDSMRRTEKGKQ